MWARWSRRRRRDGSEAVLVARRHHGSAARRGHQHYVADALHEGIRVAARDGFEPRTGGRSTTDGGRGSRVHQTRSLFTNKWQLRWPAVVERLKEAGDATATRSLSRCSGTSYHSLKPIAELDGPFLRTASIEFSPFIATIVRAAADGGFENWPKRGGWLGIWDELCTGAEGLAARAAPSRLQQPRHPRNRRLSARRLRAPRIPTYRWMTRNAARKGVPSPRRSERM